MSTDVLPLKLQWLLRSPWHTEKSLHQLIERLNYPAVSAADPLNIIRRAIPPRLPLKVTEIIPRLKDGGAFVKFFRTKDIPDDEIEQAFKEHLQAQPVKPWFSPFRSVRAYLVRGRPWLEDLYRLPSSRLKVEFVAATPGGQASELSQETLYSLFRPYGKLTEITPQPADSKVLPRFAYLDFARVRYAIVAKNCMHGLWVGEGASGEATTILRLLYEPRIKTHAIRDWLFSHPRLVIPVLAAIIATITVAIFDP